MTDLEKIRADLRAQIKENRAELKDIDRVLVPILKILQSHDVPIQFVSCSLGYSSIKLQPEAKLTESAYAEITKFLGFEARQETMDSHLGFFWSLGPGPIKHPFIQTKFWWLVISNGNNTCKVKEIRKEHKVQTTEIKTKWVAIGNCAPFEEEQTDES